MLVLTKECEPGGTYPDGRSVNKGLDYVTMPSIASMKQVNSIVSLRYLIKTGPLNKAITRAEVQALHAAGIGVIAQFERSATTPLKGFSQGLTDGNLSRDAALNLGYPVGLPIIAAVDMAVTSSNITTVRQYLLGFKQALGEFYDLGIYGGTVIIKACLDISVLNWVAGARSWSSNPPYPGHGLPIHFVQYISGSSPQWDMNDIILPSQMWLPHEIPDFPPDPEPIPVPTPGEKFMTTTTLTVLGRPERPYDSRSPGNPSLANPMKVNEIRPINIGHNTANVVQLHVSVDQANTAGYLTFWDGSDPRPDVASVNFTPGQVSQCLVTAPVVNGQVFVYSNAVCHLILDLQAVGV